LNRLEELLRHAELRLPLIRCTERERIADLVRTVTGWTADAEKLMARRGPERLTIDAAQALLDKADAEFPRVLSDSRATLKAHVHLVKRFIHVVQRRVLPHDEQAAQHLSQLNQSMAEVAPAAAWALDGSAATTASSGSRLPNTRTRAATLDLNSSSSGASSAGVGAKMLLREARAWLKSLEQKVPYVFVPEARYRDGD